MAILEHLQGLVQVIYLFQFLFLQLFRQLGDYFLDLRRVVEPPTRIALPDTLRLEDLAKALAEAEALRVAEALFGLGCMMR